MALDGPAYKMGQAPENVPITYAPITDETSNTAIYSEWIKGTSANSVATNSLGLDQVFTAGVPELPDQPRQALQQACLPSTKLHYSGKGVDWVNDKVANGSGYSHVMTPNTKSCVFSTGSSNSTDDTMISASSRHSGGVNVGFLDGSIHFIKSSISAQT